MDEHKLTFVETLNKDITKWNDAASLCESLIPSLTHDWEKDRMTQTARDYREHAESLRKLVNLAEQPS